MKRKQTLTHLAKTVALIGITALPIVSSAQLKVSGLLFGDYAYKTQADSLGSRRKITSEYNQLPLNYSGFNIRRAYINFDYDINEKIHVEAVLAHESTTPTGAVEVLPDNNNSVFLKYANVRVKQVFTGTDLILGQQRTPTFATGGGSEPLWEYRAVERTITDFNRLASSTDLGVGLEGKYMDGKLGYHLLYGNNIGAKPLFDPTTTPITSVAGSPKLYMDVYYKFFNRLEVQLYYDYACFNYNWDSAHTKFQTTSSTIKPMIAWIQPGLFTVGVEYYIQTNTHAANDYSNKTLALSYGAVGANTAAIADLRSTAPTGLSFFGHVVIIKDKDTNKVSKRVGYMQDGQKGGILSLFARYDSYNPDANMTDALASNKKNHTAIQSTAAFYTFGLDWEPYKNIHIMPNVWAETFTQKYSSAELATTPGYQAQKNATDMVLRLSLWYNF